MSRPVLIGKWSFGMIYVNLADNKTVARSGLNEMGLLLLLCCGRKRRCCCRGSTCLWTDRRYEYGVGCIGRCIMLQSISEQKEHGLVVHSVLCAFQRFSAFVGRVRL